jgi:hypothetical protein
MFKNTIESTFARRCLIVARLVVLTATGGGAATATAAQHIHKARKRLLDLTKKQKNNKSQQYCQ